jgi:hypothetical protein
MRKPETMGPAAPPMSQIDRSGRDQWKRIDVKRRPMTMTGLGPNLSERRPPIGFATTAVASWLRRTIAISATAFGLGKADLLE